MRKAPFCLVAAFRTERNLSFLLLTTFIMLESKAELHRTSMMLDRLKFTERRVKVSQKFMRYDHISAIGMDWDNASEFKALYLELMARSAQVAGTIYAVN